MLLRDDQIVVVQGVLEAIRQGRTRILIVGATGVGKTVILVAILAALCQTDFVVRRIVWLAHRDRLLLQGADSVYAIAAHLLAALIVLNIASSNIPEADVMVIDEAHHDAAPSYRRLDGRVRPRIVIAATATPFRQDRNGLLFDAIINTPSIDELIGAGILCPYEHVALLGDMNPDALVDAYLTDPERWGQSIIFVWTTLEARRIVAAICRKGIRAAAVLGDSYYKDAAIADFGRGALQVLVSCHAISEGVDVPNAKSVFLRNANRATVQQAAGRVLRRSGDKVANVVQFADASVPFFTIAKPRRRWFGPTSGSWSELPVEPTWPDAASDTRYATAALADGMHLSTHPSSN